MKDFEISFNKQCPCSQSQCPIRGNCVLCVQNHLDHKRHLPECMENMLRFPVKEICELLELKTEDTRPDAEFWKDYDKKGLIKKSLDRHKKND